MLQALMLGPSHLPAGCLHAGAHILPLVPPTNRHLSQALPNWSLLTLAGHPVALSVENCAVVPEIRASSSAKVGGRAWGPASLAWEVCGR